MNTLARATATSLLAASLLLALGACKKIDPDAPKPAKAGATPSSLEIEGLATEEEQAGYAIGLQIGSTLAEIKDDVDFDAIVKAMRTSMDGEAPLMDEAQARQAFEAFGQRMQARMASGNREAGEAFLATNAKQEGVQVTASGLQYKVLTEGTGPKPGPESRVSVHYKGSLLDGTVFDSSYEREEPAVFTLSSVVPGWQEGLQLMPAGSKYMLWLPSGLGYGDVGTPGGPIAPGSALVFEVELLDVLADPAE
ncbi:MULTISPECIES: FKBP-type peptidyl-prolyl cis-trans isomerase [unclassified Luteimonas]|uniref:FKBP-type peptidyl-prolyl cis-trans isomerase N-terminal domain-containing protein n=1 Tax=unclassified Luteimonas TaxID=2629088 RepID=UPI0018F07441|nr:MULTISPECIES: FKBP-type peptidyl-prolyl cis-trans isomerase [unclassified Luteimonas]MBJ6977757.1 FKBP-type peptidyl-prolyl cis-trans isomerase [Luteimonas sp. MC1895]MBJ6984575.1 FKBP-type peptidyl-prolyl cis-trans isomerase [Luteimonas sp. MC1750]QQO04820.1 FKBP-type peptidyl-prolyl cis-trans isomerase [Luteimonas sp. MC1750]